MGSESLARGVPPAAASTVVALTVTGRITAGPVEGRTIRFGRNRTEVDLSVGETDPRVSRRHGLLVRREDHWWVSNTGRLPIRLPETKWLFPGEEPVPLPTGYTPMFIRGSREREHLVELYIAGEDGGQPTARYDAVTHQPRQWPLSDEERLLLVVLGQRYLYHDANPQPISRQQAALLLAELQPAANWSVKRVEHLVSDVRLRLSAAGVRGLLREEVGEPVGNSLNDNLLRELILSTTLVPPDLALLDALS